MGLYPELSAKAVGIYSKASANPLMAYYSMVAILSASALMAREQAISGAPPPYTILLVLIKFLTTHMESWIDLIASSTIMLDPPLTNTVTAEEDLHPSITNILSLVVPN